MIFRSVSDFKNSIEHESIDGERIYYDYGPTEVLQFIKTEGENLTNVSAKGKTTALELLEAIYPEIRTDEKILESLINIGGKKVFEEIVASTDLFLDETPKLKMYYTEIKNTNRKIEELEERIDEEKIKKAQPEIIDGLESQLEQEELWKNILKSRKREIVQSITERTEMDEKSEESSKNINTDIHEQQNEYNEEGYNKEGYNDFGYTREGIDRDGKYEKIFDMTRKEKEKELADLIQTNRKLDDILAEFEAINKMENNKEQNSR